MHIEAVRGVYEKGLLFAGRIAVQVSEAAFDRGAEYRFGFSFAWYNEWARRCRQKSGLFEVTSDLCLATPNGADTRHHVALYTGIQEKFGQGILMP